MSDVNFKIKNLLIKLWMEYEIQLKLSKGMNAPFI